MESCLAAAALNGVDRRSLQRSARLGREVLERAKRRAVDWHSQERPRGSTGVLSREGPYHARRPPAGPLCLLPGEREERHPTLSASFRTMAEFMDYTSSQCGKYYSSVPEEGGTTHVCRYHRGKSTLHLCSETRNGQRKDRGEAAVGPGGCLPASEHTLESSQSVSTELLASWTSPLPCHQPADLLIRGSLLYWIYSSLKLRWLTQCKIVFLVSFLH